MNIRPRLARRRNGKLYWITEDGEFAPYIGGGAPDPDDDVDDDADDDDDDDSNDDDDEPKFTQADLNKIISRKERKLRRSIRRDIEEELGVSVDEAVSTLKKVASGEKPDVTAEVQALRRQLDEREIELNKRELEFTVREKLQEAGVKSARVKKAVRLVDLDEDPDEDDIATAIAELRDDMPELFVTATEDEDEETPRKRRLPSSGPKPPARKPAPKEDAFSEGASLAKNFQTSIF